MRLSGAIQEALLALLLWDDSSSEVAILVPTKLFDLYLSDIAEAAVSYLEKYKEPPREHAIDIINNIIARHPDQEEFYKKIWRSLNIIKSGINKEYVISQTRVFVRHQTIKRAVAQSARALQRDTEAGLIEAEGMLRRALEEEGKVLDLGTKLSDPSALRFLDEEYYNAFPTGISQLDEVGLGPARKRLHLMIAPSGLGKTWYLIHLAKIAIVNRLKVAYVTLELSEEEVLLRIYQSLFSMSKRRELYKAALFEKDENGRFLSLVDYDLNPELSINDNNIKSELQDRQKILKRKVPLFVKQFPTGYLTLTELENYLHSLEHKNNFVPDILILDYADCMSLDRKNYRIELGDLYRKLRGIGVKRNMAIATASQANRTGKQSKWVLGEHISEDYSKIATCDVAITYNQTEDEFKLGVARLYVAKGRMDKDKFAILISQNYATGQFCLDSVGFDTSFWSHVESV